MEFEGRGSIWRAGSGERRVLLVGGTEKSGAPVQPALGSPYRQWERKDSDSHHKSQCQVPDVAGKGSRAADLGNHSNRLLLRHPLSTEGLLPGL